MRGWPPDLEWILYYMPIHRMRCIARETRACVLSVPLLFHRRVWLMRRQPKSKASYPPACCSQTCILTYHALSPPPLRTEKNADSTQEQFNHRKKQEEGNPPLLTQPTKQPKQNFSSTPPSLTFFPSWSFSSTEIVSASAPSYRVGSSKQG